MSKPIEEYVDSLKESIKRDPNFGKDEVVMVVCTAAIVKALNDLEHQVYMKGQDKD